MTYSLLLLYANVGGDLLAKMAQKAMVAKNSHETELGLLGSTEYSFNDILHFNSLLSYLAPEYSNNDYLHI